ncbi:MAG: GTP-binding protein, partial [Mycobacteriaceae bacterium]
MKERRTPVILVVGTESRDLTAQTASELTAEGTTVVHHDLAELRQGVVRRTVTDIVDGELTVRTKILELAHGCVSCTLREDLLPLLRKLHQRSSVQKIVIHCDQYLEAEALCWAIQHVVVAGVVGQIDGPASRDVAVEAVLTCLDGATWFAEATGDEALDDDRTIAQIAVGQAAFADAIVIDGHAVEPLEKNRLMAIFARLAPGVPVQWLELGQKPHPVELLENLPSSARRGRIDDAHSPLLRGEPPLDREAGIELVEFTASRPFHPERLHEAIDVLLDGVV